MRIQSAERIREGVTQDRHFARRARRRLRGVGSFQLSVGGGAVAMTGEPDLLQDAPIEVHQSRCLFTRGDPHAHYSASLAQLPSGRLVLVFSWSPGIQRRNNGVLMTSRSDNDGTTWTVPEALYAQPGWDCMHLGGLMPFSETRLLLGLGRIQMDASLPGDEPCTGWYLGTTCSADGGETWAPEGPEVRLFPGVVGAVRGQQSPPAGRRPAHAGGHWDHRA